MSQNPQIGQKHSVESKPGSHKHASVFQQPKRRSKFFVGYGKRAEGGKSHHNHHNGTDQVGCHRGLTNDESSHNTYRISYGPRQPDTCFPDQLKGYFHEQDLTQRRKRHPFSGCRHGQDQVGGKKAGMPRSHGHIDSRETHGEDRCKKAQDSCKRRGFKPVVPVVAGLKEAVVIRRKYQYSRRMIHHQYDTPFQNGRRRPVRTFRRLKLRKRRQPVLFHQLLQHTAVQDPVDLISVESLPDRVQQTGIDQIFHIDQRRHGMRTGSYGLLLYFHARVPESLTY